YGTGLMRGLIVVATVLYLNGAALQIAAIRRTGRTGGLSRTMHQLFLGKDFASALFGLSMGLASGWPVVLMSTAGALVQTTTLWHFRWVRRRHDAPQPPAPLPAAAAC